MQAVQQKYVELTQQIDKRCTELRNVGCKTKAIYLGESEYKLLRLQLSPHHIFVVMYPTPPDRPFEMFCGMRVHQVYDFEHLEITWEYPF
jgi:hypothetical protein